MLHVQTCWDSTVPFSVQYGMCCVLFDGYEEQSTKYHEHKRRQTGNVSAAIIIVIAENAQAQSDQPALFSKEKNETNCISLLTTHLRDTGRHVEVSRGDVDTLIVCSAPEFTQNGQIVTVVAEDTYVLILLVYHWINGMEDIFTIKESRLSGPEKSSA